MTLFVPCELCAMRPIRLCNNLSDIFGGSQFFFFFVSRQRGGGNGCQNSNIFARRATRPLLSLLLGGTCIALSRIL
jgi:hypothetical protein